jgi:hypothetical protein
MTLFYLTQNSIRFVTLDFFSTGGRTLDAGSAGSLPS